jgi:TctA family transporter
MTRMLHNIVFWAVGGWFVWAAIAVGVIGAGVSLYGANKQSKDNKAAQDQNAALQAQQNQSQWANYLMQRGIMPTVGTNPGVMPGPGQSRIVNTKLPLWATVPQGYKPGAPVPLQTS